MGESSAGREDERPPESPQAESPGVSVTFFVAAEKVLRRLHGQKMVTQEGLNRIIALLGEAEAAFMALPADEKSRRRKRR